MIVNGIEYETCPRCHLVCTTGNIESWRCIQCGMQIIFELLRAVIGERWIIYWSIGNHLSMIYKATPCIYHTSGFRAEGGMIIISHLLPYDITSERLKLLLLFS